ncbi:MAG: peptidoglycan DD-metalloendopeptidase family protein [Fibrobacterota bacterium]
MSLKTISRLLAAVLLCAGLLSAQEAGEPSAEDIATRKNELESIKQQLRDSRKEIAKLSTKEADLVTRLRKIDDNITLLGHYLKKLGETEAALEDDIDSIRVDLDNTGRGLAWRKGVLRQRVRAIYKNGRFSDLDVLFSANSFSDFLRRNVFFKRIADHDRRLIQTIFREQRRIAQKKRDLEDRLSDVLVVKGEKNSEQKKFTNQKEARNKLLNKVKGEKDSYLAMVRELEARQREMNKIIEVLEAARESALRSKKLDRLASLGDFGKLKGKLPWPAAGKILRPFGTNVHPVYKTKTINNGIDIEVEAGDPIKSVAPGEVLYTGQASGFGNFIIVGHGKGFYSLYANLAAMLVKKGQTVDIGREIGRAGDTGSFDGVKLHFELRHQREILDPGDWLGKKGG